jgi:TRAP transporter TAXI family solute receptor
MKRLLLGALSALALTTVAAQAAPTPKFRLCTGDTAKNYYKAGQHLRTAASSEIDIEVKPTKGSLDNLDMILENGCDGAFVQSDALLVYADRNAQAISAIERSGVLYQEHAHLLCNRNAGISDISDLTPNHKIAVGTVGSGSQVTWSAFVLTNKKRYGDVKIDTRDGMRALSAVSDGAQVQCMLSVASIGTSFMRNDAQGVGDRVVLAGTDDSGMNKVSKDARGNSVYSYGQIPAGTYSAIQPSGRVFGTKPVGTLVVDALFVTSTAWVNANEKTNEALIRAFLAAGPDIKALAAPK